MDWDDDWKEQEPTPEEMAARRQRSEEARDINLIVVSGKTMAKEKVRVLRTPSMVRTANGHAVNKWCGSCAHKEIQAGSSAEGRRWCTKLAQEVDIDDICPEWELDEKLAKL